MSLWWHAEHKTAHFHTNISNVQAHLIKYLKYTIKNYPELIRKIQSLMAHRSK